MSSASELVKSGLYGRVEAETPAHITSKQAGTSQSFLDLTLLLSGVSHHRGGFPRLLSIHESFPLISGGQTAPVGRQKGRKVRRAGVSLQEGFQGVSSFSR